MVVLFVLLFTPWYSTLAFTISIIGLRGVLGWGIIHPFYIGLGYYIDQLSGIILIITILLLVLILYSSETSRILTITFTTLLLILCIMITTTSIVIFYLWFELSLIPIVILILGWGKQPERLLASLYILMYTISGSFPFLFVLLYLKLIILDPFNILAQPLLISLCVVLPFCVKLPIYYFHLWLPKAHVEAPVFGSMVLAATLLKIGSYGIWRLSPLVNSTVSLIITIVSLFRASMCAWITLSQVDIKAIIAYSRVVHIGIVIGAIIITRFSSSLPALIIMISHGICRSGLFYCATVRYEQVSTRSLPIIQGLSLVSPNLTLAWVLLLLMNLRSPPTLSLISELFMSGSLLLVDNGLILGISIIIVLVLFYSLMLYYSIYHGSIISTTQTPCNNFKELTISNAHTIWFLLWLVAIWLYEI